ncbi:hypothetical protein FQ192_26795 [Pseudomonas sp. ANT_J12]|nr:hypothetical protein FQ192_26795 [Pseudomonas sp. ANT_J12]
MSAFSYDAYGRLQQLSNENDEAYRFEWDVLDRLSVQVDLDGSYRVYHYNAVDDITGTDAHPTPAPEPRNTYEDGPPPSESDAPIKHRFARDAVGRLLRKTTDDGVTDYAYDPADNLLAISFSHRNGEQQQLKFRYDALASDAQRKQRCRSVAIRLRRPRQPGTPNPARPAPTQPPVLRQRSPASTQPQWPGH